MKPFRERSPVVVGLVCVAALSVITLFAFSLGKLTFLRGVYLVKADFADAAGITPENEVRVAGLKVGKVRSVELVSADGSSATTNSPAPVPAAGDVKDRVRLTLEIKNGIHLGNLTTAEIKLKTLLGSKFVDVEPGGAAPFLEEGASIPLDRTKVPFEIYQVTNKTVASLGQIDSVALNDMLRSLAEITDDPDGNFGRLLDGLSKATDSLKGRDQDIQDLLASADQVVGILASRSEELGRIVDSGSKVLTALRDRQGDVRRFATQTGRVAGQLSDLISKTRSDLDPALTDLHEVLLVASKHLNDVDVVLQTLGPSAHSFANIFTDGTWGEIFLQSVLTPLPIR